MFIFKIVGIALIALGVVAGFALLLIPFGIMPLKGPGSSLWWFFVLCFIGGFILSALGSNGAEENLLKTAGSILLIIGLISATAIFLNKVDFIQANDTTDLWALFLICTIAGAVSVVVAENL